MEIDVESRPRRVARQRVAPDVPSDPSASAQAPAATPPARRPKPGIFLKWKLRHFDQWAVGFLVGISILAIAVYVIGMNDQRRSVIEIDRAPLEGPPFLVDLNSADWPELSTLPGIGEQLAKAIVARREAMGPFDSPDELEKVPGIGPETLKRIRPHLLGDARQ